jgi:hypothetical protein
MNVQANRPELVVIGLAHLQFRHPIKDFARIEITKNPALELQKERRMNGVTEIEQPTWSGQSIDQSTFRHTYATHV